MWLLVVAAFGMLVPNGLFVYWLLHDFTTGSAVLSDRLSLVSLLGTLCFGILLNLWLNWRAVPEPRPTFAEWWQAV